METNEPFIKKETAQKLEYITNQVSKQNQDQWHEENRIISEIMDFKPSLKESVLRHLPERDEIYTALGFGLSMSLIGLGFALLSYQ